MYMYVYVYIYIYIYNIYMYIYIRVSQALITRFQPSSSHQGVSPFTVVDNWIRILD